MGVTVGENGRFHHKAAAAPKKMTVHTAAIPIRMRGSGVTVSVNNKSLCLAMARVLPAFHIPKRKTPNMRRVTVLGRCGRDGTLIEVILSDKGYDANKNRAILVENGDFG